MVFLLVILVLGSSVFAVLAILAAEQYRRVRPAALPRAAMPPISVLKPLHGMDEGLEENLRSFFEQDCSSFEMLFGVESENDAAVAVARRLIAQYPQIESRIVIAGPSPIRDSICGYCAINR